MLSFSSAAIRKTAFAAAVAGMTLASAAMPSFAQTAKASVPPAPKGVTQAECGVFGKYLVEEIKVSFDEISKGFIQDAKRFIKSGCNNYDADGDIHIVTRTLRDGIALEVALRRMGKTDILGGSGVAHCHRPEGGPCTTRVGTSAPKKQASAELN